MSMKFLGSTFDFHGGGKDLVFPHHENEIAQSEGANGCQFVRYWLHNGFVNINSEKMSKSLGNFFTIRTVLESYDPETLRFFILSGPLPVRRSTSPTRTWMTPNPAWSGSTAAWRPWMRFSATIPPPATCRPGIPLRGGT